jgi:hypothetical protein
MGLDPVFRSRGVPVLHQPEAIALKQIASADDDVDEFDVGGVRKKGVTGLLAPFALDADGLHEFKGTHNAWAFRIEDTY